MGIIISSETVRKNNLKEGDEIMIEIKKKNNVLKEAFGAVKFSKPTRELLKEIREENKSKYE
ncbi:MAG: hypothetical protein ACLFUO_05130 [Candidatus Woesearchaeota archaeon]